MTDNLAQAYPLSWPAGWPRTKHRTRSHFKDHSIHSAIRQIQKEIDLLAGSRLIISTNIPIKRDGTPFSNPPRITDPGAAIYFQLNGRPISLPCDKWYQVEENLWAIAKHVESLRGQDRWGVGSVDRAFAGYAALPDHTGDWSQILGLPTLTPTEPELAEAYRAALRRHHPDHGGDGNGDKLAAVKAAHDRARAALGLP